VEAVFKLIKTYDITVFLFGVESGIEINGKK
jgi:hypothetical protein